MRGRLPIPDHLKLVTGNPGHRPIDLDHAPEPARARPECPSHLDQRAREEWARIVPELEIAGLLTKVDRAMLAAYCQAYSRWQLAETRIAELAEKDPDKCGLIKTAANGYQMLSQWLVISNKAQEQLRAYAGEFGMTPVSRTRVRALAAQGSLFGDDPMEAFLRAGEKARA